MTKVTKTPYAVVLPITMLARMTVKPKDTAIAFIGLGPASAEIHLLGGKETIKCRQKLTDPTPAELAQAMRYKAVRHLERKTIAVSNWW